MLTAKISSKVAYKFITHSHTQQQHTNIYILLTVQLASLSTHPHFPHRLAAVVLDVHRHADILAMRIPGLIEARPQADTSVLQEERLVHRTLWSTAAAAKRTRCITANHTAHRAAATRRSGERSAANAANADSANAAGNSGAIVLWRLKA